MNLKKVVITVLIIILASLFLINYTFDQDKQPEDINIILIVLESIRADHLQCQGYDRDTAPNICELAEDGVLFENAYVQGSSTFSAVPVIITGKNPATVSLETWRHSMPDDINTVIDILDEQNYKTFSNFGDYGVYSEDKQNYTEEISKFISQDYETIANVENGRLFHWWFIGEHAHFPYAPEDEFRKWDNVSLNHSQISEYMQPQEQLNLIKDSENITTDQAMEELINLYDGDILMGDYKVGRYLERLKEDEIYNDSMIIITSDHGQMFGRNNNLGHEYKPYQELIHVPFVIRFPDDQYAGKRIEDNVRLADLVPTIYDYINIEDTPNTYGKSLMPLIEGEKLDLEVVSINYPDKYWTYKQENYKYFLRNVKEHCVHNENPKGEELYNLNKDPKEKNNLLEQNNINTTIIEKVDRYRKKLCEIYLDGLKDRQEPKEYEMDEDTRKKLENLGYLS